MNKNIIALVGDVQSCRDEHVGSSSDERHGGLTPVLESQFQRKTAIRNKSKYNVRFAKDRTQENFELKKKHRNIAGKVRRKAISAYWRKKSEELSTNPSAFYNTFKPFISDKRNESPGITLRTTEAVTSNQPEVAEILAIYFTTSALNIGGNQINSLTEKDHSDHTSVKAIRNRDGDPRPGNSGLEFINLTHGEVRAAVEQLHPRNSCGWDPGAPPRLLKMVASGITPSLRRLY